MHLDKVFRLIIAASLLTLATDGRALAHKVNVFAYAEGDSVYTESYFNDGRKCRNSTVSVYDSSGEKLREGRTDDEGIFAFPVAKREELKIVLSASMGHRAEYVLSRGELTGEETREEVSSAQDSAGGEAVADGDIARSVDQVLTRRLGPLTEAVRRLEKQQERASLRDILGGIGYIFGLMGLYYYFRSRSL